MRYLLTNAEMRQADGYTIEKQGVPSLVLMERAGEALACEAVKLAPTGKIACVCGGGNNGGDGFVCARLLREQDRQVDVVCYAEKFSNDCLINLQKWEAVGGVKKLLDGEYALIVDCLYGTGFRGSLQGKDEEIVKAVNARRRMGLKVLSADVPSGLCGNNGRALGTAVQADVTLCIGEVKTGTLLNDGLDFCGEVKRVDIGICLPDTGYAVETMAADICKLLPMRKRNAHKGSFGRAAIVGGGIEYTGAAYLSAAACLRSGVGYTLLYTPSQCLPYYILKSPELILKSSNEGGMYAFNEEIMASLLGCDAVAFGMGMGVSNEVYKGIAYLLERYKGKLIIDADGLNSLAQSDKTQLKQLLLNKKCDVLLTPHVKEFSRLSSLSVEEILDNPIACAKQLAQEWKVNILLKNATTVITDGMRVSVNATGNSGQAKGGSGDVLSGLLAGLCASGLSGYDSAVAGAWLAGKAAEYAEKDLGVYAMLPSDVIRYFGKAFAEISQS